MSKDILSKIVTYEQAVFDEYLSKRNSFLEHLKGIKSLDNSQMLVLVNDIKAIIDPIKTSISEIEFYFTNTEFKNNKNMEENNFFQKTGLFYLLLLLTGSPELSELTELSEERSESVSDSSESVSLSVNSSRSVSETFSSKN